jgi:anti-sigma factor RsiW
MANHEQIKDRLVSLVLGELAEAESAEVRTHALDCVECRTELRHLERLLDVAGQRKGVSAQESLNESTRNDLLAATRGETESKTIARPELRRAWAWRRIMTSSSAKMAVAAGIEVLDERAGPLGGVQPSGQGMCCRGISLPWDQDRSRSK